MISPVLPSHVGGGEEGGGGQEVPRAGRHDGDVNTCDEEHEGDVLVEHSVEEVPPD